MLNWRFWECGFGWLKKAQLIVFVKHSAGTWHVARAAIIINIIIIIFPPGNQHFSSFLQNSDRNKALGSQVPRSSWGPRSKLFAARRVCSSFQPQHQGPSFGAGAPCGPHRSWAPPEKEGAPRGKLGGGGRREVPGEGPSGFTLLLWAPVSPAAHQGLHCMAARLRGGSSGAGRCLAWCGSSVFSR